MLNLKFPLPHNHSSGREEVVCPDKADRAVQHQSTARGELEWGLAEREGLAGREQTSHGVWTSLDSHWEDFSREMAVVRSGQGRKEGAGCGRQGNS